MGLWLGLSKKEHDDDYPLAKKSLGYCKMVLRYEGRDVILDESSPIQSLLKLAWIARRTI